MGEGEIRDSDARDAKTRNASGLFGPPQPLAEIAGKTCGLLSQASVQIALAEAGTGGEIAGLLSAVDARRTVLMKARAFDTPEQLAVALKVSPAKVDAFGATSAMVAAEAAAELIDTYEGGWGLVVMAPGGNRAAESGVENQGGRAPAAFVALGTPSTTIIEQCPSDRVIESTLELLRQQALRRMQHSQASATG